VKRFIKRILLIIKIFKIILEEIMELFMDEEFSLPFWLSDVPLENSTIFQDPATAVMESLIIFNEKLLFLVITIVLLISWLLVLIVKNYIEIDNEKKIIFSHDNPLEIVWTSLPTFILIGLSFPSFSLLYSLDEMAHPYFTFKIYGHQWFWTYENTDLDKTRTKNQFVKYGSYMLDAREFMAGMRRKPFRLLEVNRQFMLPAGLHLRLLVTAVDVLHSWTVPSFGIKIDACPGRLNQVTLYLKRLGAFFGQCSEICGIGHGFMPCSVYVMTLEQYEIETAKIEGLNID
jgi:cytochrome c oxidase subunit 2